MLTARPAALLRRFQLCTRSAYGCHMNPDTEPRFGGSLQIQVDPVVINCLDEIQRAQHAGAEDLEAAVKASLMEYVDRYQDAGMFRALPDWAKP